MSAAIVSVVGDKLLHGGLAVEAATALKDKLVALYFSAHWCPPCRQFTPEFARVYNSLQSSGKALAVVFISADQDQQAFDEYYKDQPWYAIPYAEEAVRDRVNEKFEIKGIPALIVLNADGAIVTREGRLDVMKHKEKAFDMWEQKVQKMPKTDKAETTETTENGQTAD